MSKYLSTVTLQIQPYGEDDDQTDDEIDNDMKLNEMLIDVKRWSLKHDDFEYCQTKTINLLLMGRTRTGKTTMAHVLRDPTYLPPPTEIYSQTKEIQIHPYGMKLRQSDTNLIYCINIIDTPGMFDRTKYAEKSLKNTQIRSTIDECLTENLGSIHLFAFVINIHSNLEEEDIRSMIFVKKNYPQLKDFMCLIVTHCEEIHHEERKRKVEAFFQSEQIFSNHLKEFFSNQVFFMGSLKSELRFYPNSLAIKQQIRNVHQMRRTFLTYLINHIDQRHFFRIQQIQPNSSSCSLA